MTTTHCLPHQALVDSICEAVDHGDGHRLAQLLDLLELVADAELLDRVEQALRAPAWLPLQRSPRPGMPGSQQTGDGDPKRT
jgi:hypothetical protein